MKGKLFCFLKFCVILNSFLLCSCIRDKCFRLCEECDLVFHKSAMKKRHIRIPTLLEPASSSSNNKSSPATASIVTGAKANNLLTVSISGSQSTQTPKEEISNQDIFNLESVFDDLSKSSSHLILSTILANHETSLICSKSPRNHQDVTLWKEMLSNLVAASIRTILDDQKVRL